MSKEFAIDCKDMKFPVKALVGGTHAGVQYAAGTVFDAHTQHTRDYLVDRVKRAVDYRPTDDVQAVEVGAADVAEEPAAQNAAPTDAVSEQVDDHEHKAEQPRQERPRRFLQRRE